MKNVCFWRSVLALVLAVCLLVPYIPTINAAQSNGVSFETVDNDLVSASLLNETQAGMPADTQPYADDEIVRVTIQLEGNSLVEQGFSTTGIGESRAAQSYRQMVLRQQASATRSIEAATGEILDVEWNLTMLGNIISANVAYGQIETIAGVDGVCTVQIENQYEPMVLPNEEGDSAETNMILSGNMTHVSTGWENGYTGAGSRIAIIDTGLDTDHQAVSAAAFEYALQENAANAELDYAEYIDGLNLLDTEEISGKLTQLNAYNRTASAAELVYQNTKIPYGYNYVDRNYDVTHDNDSAGNHGSHVAGTAAANRYVERDGQMVDALEATMVAGNAPDAQLLVLKVFGANGGAYESDIFAAIEDAIVLDADTVNLSLGMASPGFANIGAYESVMQNLKNCDTTVVFSAGNNFDWAFYADNQEYLAGGHLYSNDVSTHTGGSPGSSANALTVASVQNSGAITEGSLQLEGKLIEFNTQNQSPTAMRSMTSLDTSEDGSGTTYEYVMVESYGEEGDLDDLDVEGKIVLIQRGMQVNFGVKANTAAKAGAIACIVYNNVDGSINMNLEGYEYENPCVSITLGNAMKFKEAGTTHTDSSGSPYYTGQVTIMSGLSVVDSSDDFYTMSNFSSWGPTGDLVLKPEITAPGGNIYSINGGGTATDRYTTMSGTSMAAPQVSGIGALVDQFTRENGYTGRFADPQRGLNQSLLMSTAVPIVDDEGNYYPVIQQGAGLVDAAAATGADSYIKMSSDATASYDDGKVKAEVGDDPERTGVYTFGFEIHNLDGKEHTYDLSADVFAQGHFEATTVRDGQYTTEFMDKSTTPLEAVTTFTVNAEAVQSVNVPADGSVTIQATITLTDDAKENYLDTYFPCGTYLQAYVFADAQADSEGVDGTTHSIPVLGFYGSWTDPSMFWGTSSFEGQFTDNYSTRATTDGSRLNYYSLDGYWEIPGVGAVTTYEPYNRIMITAPNGNTYDLGGNPLVADDSYLPERNAVSAGSSVPYSIFNLIRNMSSSQFVIRNLDTDVNYLNQESDSDITGAYLNNLGWAEGIYEVHPNVTLDQVQEGERVRFSITVLPEYYDEGKMGYGQEPGQGATAGVTAVVDNTIPQALDITLDTETQCLQVEAADNQYVAAVVLYSASGDEIIHYTGAKQQIDPGQEAVFELDYSGTEQRQFLVQVFDYAMNMATYRVTIEEEELVYSGAMLVYNQNDTEWALSGEDAKTLKSLASEETVYHAATAIGDQVFAVTADDELRVLGATSLDSSLYIDKLEQRIVDLAYCAADGYLYGVSEENELVQIDPISGQSEVMGSLPFTTNTLACDAEGNFYSNKYGTGEVYAYTLDTVRKDASQAYDFNDDGTVTLDDAQLLLDYVSGKDSKIANADAADLDEDGDIDTYDVYLLQQTLPYMPNLLAVAYTTESKYLQAMEVDPNSGKLYWASYFTDQMQGEPIAFSFLWSIDPETGAIERHTDYWDQLTAMVILDVETSSRIPPADGVLRLNISMVEKKLAVGQTVAISAGVSPWNVEDPSIIWRSSDESIATVDANGNVTAVGIGTCQIIAASAMDESVSASCTVTVSQTLAPEETARPVSEIASVAAVVNSAKTEDNSQPATFTLELPAAADLTNGLQTVSIDTSDLTLLSISGADLLSFQQKQSLLTVGYVHSDTVSAGESAVSLTFQTSRCGDDRAIVLRELQRNNVHLEEESAVTLAAHIWSSWKETAAPGCENEGTEQRTCSVCGETEERLVTAIGHAWSEWTVTAEPDCENEGTEQRTCESCEKTEERTVAAAGHTWGDWTETEAATCLEDGLETRSCEACGKSEERNIPAAGSHTWSEWQITTQPTETENGEQTRTCSACGETESEALPATGHICYAEAFTDVNVNSWYHSAIDYVVANKLMNGTSATTFAPDANTTRGQLVTILYRAAGSPSVDGMKNPFKDVPAGTYYTNAVIWASNNGIVNGTSATTFAPEMAINREQLVTILHRYAGKPAADMTVLDGYTDAGTVSSFASAAMAWAVDNGVVNGTSATKLSPLATATRAQIAAILMRYLSA